MIFHGKDLFYGKCLNPLTRNLNEMAHKKPSNRTINRRKQKILKKEKALKSKRRTPRSVLVSDEEKKRMKEIQRKENLRNKAILSKMADEEGKNNEEKKIKNVEESVVQEKPQSKYSIFCSLIDSMKEKKRQIQVELTMPKFDTPEELLKIYCKELGLTRKEGISEIITKLQNLA